MAVGRVFLTRKDKMNTSKKNIFIATIILALICVAGITVWMIIRSAKVNDPHAEIYSEGRLVRTVRLTDETRFTVSCDSGYNTISVNNGKISVTDADCPDKVCINTGSISNGGVPIICLPHKLEIKIVSADNNIDVQIN